MIVVIRMEKFVECMLIVHIAHNMVGKAEKGFEVRSEKELGTWRQEWLI